MSILRRLFLYPFAPASAAEKRPLLAGMSARLHAALAIFLAQPVKRYSPATTADPGSFSAVLRNGDVLLTEGNTRAAALIKCLTRSTWSHVSMYVGPLEEGPDPRCIVEADIVEGVRSIRLSELEGLNVRVLRPIGLNDSDRSRLAQWVVSKIGGEYDLKHAWALARRFLPAPPKTNLPPALNGIADGATRFICSTLIANAFALVGHSIAPVHTAGNTGSVANHLYVIPGDFETASVFEVVGPPKNV
jgi:Permuted papain-like amidase enzyme, YaeF/YiiX, C92 family